MPRILLDMRSMESYRTFLKVKSLPRYDFEGRTAIVPEEYASLVGVAPQSGGSNGQYTPHRRLFDYQRDIAALAIRLRKFAIFADCGLGKTLMFLEFARYVAKANPERKVLIISPLMVVEQTRAESARFYDEDAPVRIASADIQRWLDAPGGGIGITNYESMRHEPQGGNLAGLILDESSMLKSHYGKYGTNCIRLGKGVPYKLACTGTPAPNDRIEYANHAVFLDQYPTVNAFLARFFVNKGQTQERWILKPHAKRAFAESLAAWSIFVAHPGVYGWKDNANALQPVHVHVDRVDLTDSQRAAMQEDMGVLFAGSGGGITSRIVAAQIAKGTRKGRDIDTRKPHVIRELVESWHREESTIIWCLYNREQAMIAKMLPDAANISGDTPHEQRMELISEFQSGARRVLISKPKILGFGLNLQIASRMVFSGLQDSYEQYYQAIKRANRYGATRPLNVHIPVTELEEPMVDNVLRKAHRVQQDSEEQERMCRYASKWI